MNSHAVDLGPCRNLRLLL